MKTISQRELRNDNATIMRGVEQGEVYTVTRRGVPIARLGPLSAATDLRCDRPAKRRPVYTAQTRVRISTPTSALLDDLRGDR
ncbi:MAG TPA: type II toxin-antitoxin system prevent-host-death family antitoxin [Intrasporangiaceae bacterium]|nr:type II toxin-antitoxin system prevent-host-death family antitoxin [Intrasporangiaceae bacterium]